MPFSRPRLELLEDRLCPAWTVTDLGAFTPVAINEPGQVVGTDAAGAWIWEDGVRGSLEPLSPHAPLDLNDHGQVTGTYYWPWFSGGFFMVQEAVLWEDGVMNAINGSPSAAIAHNNAGQILGWYGEEEPLPRHVYWLTSPDEWMYFAEAMPELNVPIDINDQGQLIGSDWSGHLVLVTDDDGLFGNGGATFTQVGTLAGSGSTKLNNAGQVLLGNSFWSNGVTSELGFAGRGLNDAGQVVGSANVNGQSRAMLWQNGQAIDLNSFIDPTGGWALTAAVDINQHGEIIGTGTVGGQQRAFLLSTSPLPELPFLTINNATVTEGDSSTIAEFTVTLSAPSSEPVTVNYTTANGSAVAGSDYLAAAGQVTFAAGETSKTIAVPIQGDASHEADEAFFVALSGTAGAILGRNQAVGTILDDDPLPALRISDVTVTEGNTGTRSAAFAVVLSAASTLPVTVPYTTANGTAIAPGDYLAASGTLSFAPGETTKIVTVLVKGDRAAEPSENFLVNLGSAGNATIADGQGRGTILDDEPRIRIDDVARAEGHSGKILFVFTVSLSAAYDQTVTVRFATANGTARTADNDYVSTSGTLTFAPGQTTKTITVQIRGDRKREANETFFLNLSGATNAVFEKAQALGTILNDD